MANPKNITAQERALAEAQQMLERIDKMRAQMAKQVEQEMKLLAEMRKTQEDFTQGTPGTMPDLGSADISGVRSQYDQFSSTLSNKRLRSMNENNGLASDISFTDKIPVKKDDEPIPRASDRRNHYESVDPATDIGTMYYVSGYYTKAKEKGSAKEYEYRLWPTTGKVSIGETVQAPVHPAGYHQGRSKSMGMHDLDYVITDIYTKEKFHQYHDDIR